MRLLFIFMDGLGLGADDPALNPLAASRMPHLRALLGGKSLLASSAPGESELASFRALDAQLGVNSTPQSATGQAALLCGVNVPLCIGYHYGPKPDAAVRQFLTNGNLFHRLRQAGKRIRFLNAYPPRYFQAIRTGRRMHAAIPLAMTSAGVKLPGEADLKKGEAISADLTGLGWRQQLGITDAPVVSPDLAGVRAAALAQSCDLAFFEYWLSDLAGHHQDIAEACRLLEEFDAFLGGLLQAWDEREGMVLVTSDHGNLEDLSTRRHTVNPVPLLLIGSRHLRTPFCEKVQDLTHIAPAILRLLQVEESP